MKDEGGRGEGDAERGTRRGGRGEGDPEKGDAERRVSLKIRVREFRDIQLVGTHASR